jgi:hypothetical protein
MRGTHAATPSLRMRTQQGGLRLAQHAAVLTLERLFGLF